MKKFVKSLFILFGMFIFVIWQLRRIPLTMAEQHLQHDEMYGMEAMSFTGRVSAMSPGRHRQAVDTVTIRLSSFTGGTFPTRYFLQKHTDSILTLFISYPESIYAPHAITVGDSIDKLPYTFDYTIYHQGQLLNTLSLLFCGYENPDTVITRDNMVTGMHGKGTHDLDTLYTGSFVNGKREGNWAYYHANDRGYKIFEGAYAHGLRNGIFRKYYFGSLQMLYEECYKDNLPDGAFTWWHSNGCIESKRYYKNGLPIGEWTFFDEDGKQTRREQH